jgi:hypothetical protein
MHPWQSSSKSPYSEKEYVVSNNIDINKKSHIYLDIFNDDGCEQAHILLPDPSSKMGLGKLVGNLIHYKLKVLKRT